MSNPARLLEKLRSLPSDLSSNDLQVILRDLGWKTREGKGSHVVARSPRGYNIPVPVDKKKISRIYLKMVLKEIDRSGGE